MVLYILDINNLYHKFFIIDFSAAEVLYCIIIGTVVLKSGHQTLVRISCIHIFADNYKDTILDINNLYHK